MVYAKDTILVFCGDTYFEEVLEKIRDIRSSEKVFWRKILDIYKLKTKLKINNFKIKFLKKIVFYLLV